MPQSGGHLWADRFDRELTDIFATQDEVVQKIVEALAVKLSRGEEQDLKRGGTRNLEAYESWLRARQLLGSGTRETIAEAKALHRRALRARSEFRRAACRLGLRRRCPTTSMPGCPTRRARSPRASAGRGAPSSSTSASPAAMSPWAMCGSGSAATTMR